MYIYIYINRYSICHERAQPLIFARTKGPCLLFKGCLFTFKAAKTSPTPLIPKAPRRNQGLGGDLHMYTYIYMYIYILHIHMEPFRRCVIILERCDCSRSTDVCDQLPPKKVDKPLTNRGTEVVFNGVQGE